MNEYIMSRESLKRHCEATCYRFKDNPTSGVYREHKLVLELLKQTEWTPIKQGLPKEKEIVIASTEYGVYPEARFTKENGWEWAYESGADYWETLECVQAWMPLPKPYKTESKE